jgi:1-acyl-sn-glycerol-3-phosphate acyltransferase
MHDVPSIVQQQSRYTLARRLLRDALLRPVGFTLLVRPRVRGRHFVPKHGPTLLVMNHIGFIDPVIVLGVITSRWVIPMSKVENFESPGIGQLARWWGAYPVDRSRMDREALKNTMDLLNAGHCVLIAPEGTRQPTMIEAKDGFTYVAAKTNAAIVPIGLANTDQFFDNLKNLRRTPLEVRIGRPFSFKHTSRPRIPRDELQQMTREAMYQLAKLVEPAQRGVYSDIENATTATLNFL